MARVTQTILFDNLIQRIQESFNRLSRLQNQVSSGLRVEKPSDDPLAASKITFFQGELAKVDRFQTNIDEASSRLNRQDTVYGDLRNLLNEARSIAVTGANDPSNGPKTALASRVNEVLKNALDLANTQVNRQFLFSGSQTQTQAFTANSQQDPTSFTYNGDRFTISQEVSFSRFLQTTQTGLEAFGNFQHTVVAGLKVENPNAPLNAALGTSFGVPVTFSIAMGNATTPTVVTVDPRTDSLNDLVALINSANAGVVASLDPEKRLVIRSEVSKDEGRFTLTDGAANGLLTSLQVADSSGRFLGSEEAPLSIFSKLVDLKQALSGVAFKEDPLVKLSDASGQSLGLKVGDTITVAATTAAGAIASDSFAVTEKSTLNDLAQFVQEELRDAVVSSTNPTVNNFGSATAIVRVNQGKLEIINPKGVGSRDFLTLTIGTGGARPVFDTAMAALVPPAVGASTGSNVLRSEQPAANIANRIGDVDQIIQFTENNQIIVSNRQKELELLKTVHTDFRAKTEGFLSDARDVDIARAVVELRQAEQVFQAALGAGSRVIQPTLLDFLR